MLQNLLLRFSGVQAYYLHLQRAQQLTNLDGGCTGKIAQLMLWDNSKDPSPADMTWTLVPPALTRVVTRTEIP